MPLTTAELASKLWLAADILRGQIDSSDDKNHIFSMPFLKRLPDRFAEEVERAVAAGVIAGVEAVGLVGGRGGPEVGYGGRSCGEEVWARVGCRWGWWVDDVPGTD